MSKQTDVRLYEAVGRRIRQARLDKGLTVGALVEMTGVPRAALMAVEAGEIRAEPQYQFALAAALQRSIGSFYGFGERPPSVVPQVLPVPESLQRLIAAAEQLTPDQFEALERLMTTMVKRRKSH